ncbi:hypothetical protein T4A_7648 [Trichinella pseudospiralis]|uniref:Uncharacterized protein n=1 Tax=Trichinella pseudospiralis TaxID=6337 RepID=A0A0V1DY94_TRIPS|nr:hypothetical protein T4A_7648 [Trichinella pseudospiralis]
MKKLPPRLPSHPHLAVFSFLIGHWAKRYLKLPKHRRDLQISVTFRTTRAGDEFLLWQSASRHMLVFVVGSKIRLLAAMRTWGMDGTFKLVVQWYQQLFLPSMLLWQVSWGASSLLFIATALAVNLNPHPALIPAIHGYFTNTQLHGCSLHYRQAVHRKVGELELKTRYRTEEETKREIKILLATAFLPSLYRMLVRVTACLRQVLWGIYLFWHVIQ